MVYAVVHTENWDTIRSYPTHEEAEADLLARIAANPGIEDEIGLRAYDNGRPCGPFEPAVEVLGDRIPQQHLV